MQVLHSPTLDTIKMVEHEFEKDREMLSVAELKRRLPRQVNHNTLKIVLEYLAQSGKITFGPKGAIWTYATPEEIKALLKRGREL